MRLRLAFPSLLLLCAPLLAAAQTPSSAAEAETPAEAATKPAAYVPKTPYDNTPYRFNAGKRFTAAEFDAWMKSRGIRVAKGKPAATADGETKSTETAATSEVAADAAACTSAESC